MLRTIALPRLLHLRSRPGKESLTLRGRMQKNRLSSSKPSKSKEAALHVGEQASLKAAASVPALAVVKSADPMGWVGREIKSLRKAKNLSLQKVAATCGKSIGFLSQVERGLSSPSISDLHRIAEALDVQISWFFPSDGAVEPSDGGVVVRKSSRRRLAFASGISDYLLSPNLDGPLELLWSTMEPGSDSGHDAYEHAGHEAGVVLRGSLELWVGVQCFRLEEGDSFSFASSTPHRYRNPSDAQTELIWVVTPPSY